jgi:hypothetical protein
MPSLTFLGLKVAMPCRTPTGTNGHGRPDPHSVKHGGLTHSVKQNQFEPPSVKQNQVDPLVENKISLGC